ncbi:MAG TPA: purine nucleoside permease [Steroidobacteraceae bacterium]|nr:purine nucleoside permease [Steroidobacteraceae bacterium]
MDRHSMTRLSVGTMLWLLACGTSGPGLAADRMPVKVMIVSMFSREGAPWIAALKPEREVRVPGLSSDYPLVRCTRAGVCQMTTGMGHASAAASMTAVIYSGRFDLRRTYFLIAGIAGIDPGHGTIGSATWARYLVDVDIAHEIDARDMPGGWTDGYFGTLTDGPAEKPRFNYRSELFQVDEALLQRALQLSRHAALEDSADVVAYRKSYPQAPADQPPAVTQCDTASGDVWWAGPRLGMRATRYTRLLTDGHGDYCTSQQEDNATLLALTRGAQSGLTDVHRVAVLRTGSDFDRPYPGQSTFDSLVAQRSLTGAIRTSTANLVHAGLPLVQDIVAHWSQWENGVPQ